MSRKQDWNKIEAQARDMVARGIDCTEWAMSHGIAMSTTPTVAHDQHQRAYRLALDEQKLTNESYQMRREEMRDYLHSAMQMNDGRTDEQRFRAALKQQGFSVSTMKLSQLAPGAAGPVTWGGQGFNDNTIINAMQYPVWAQGITEQQFQQAKISQERSNVVINGKQYVVVCNGRVEYEDDKAKAQATAERLAHANQQDAFILKPISRTAPKRDVVTTEIKL